MTPSLIPGPKPVYRAKSLNPRGADGGGAPFEEKPRQPPRQRRVPLAFLLALPRGTRGLYRVPVPWREANNRTSGQLRGTRSELTSSRDPCHRGPQSEWRLTESGDRWSSISGRLGGPSALFPRPGVHSWTGQLSVRQKACDGSAPWREAVRAGKASGSHQNGLHLEDSKIGNQHKNTPWTITETPPPPRTQCKVAMPTPRSALPVARAGNGRVLGSDSGFSQTPPGGDSDHSCSSRRGFMA